MRPLPQLHTRLARHFRLDERGANLVEYVMLVALVSILALTAVGFFGGEVSTQFSEVGNAIP